MSAAELPLDTPAEACKSTAGGHPCELPAWHVGNHQALVDIEGIQHVRSWPRRPYTDRPVK